MLSNKNKEKIDGLKKHLRYMFMFILCLRMIFFRNFSQEAVLFKLLLLFFDSLKMNLNDIHDNLVLRKTL